MNEPKANEQQARDIEQVLGAAKGLYLVLAEKLGEREATPHIEAIDRAVAKAIVKGILKEVVR